MRIGIDASRAFVDAPTGTEKYSYEMIKHILGLPEARKHSWYLYVKKIPNITFVPGEHWSFVEVRLPRLWTQLGLASKTWIDGLDVLWVPAHTLPVLRRPNLKTVVTIHGIEYEWLPAYESLLQRWYLPLSTVYAVSTANRVIAVSNFTKQQLIERLHADEKKIEVIHEGVNEVGMGEKKNIEPQQLLDKYKIKSKKYLLFVGTVQPRKNLVRLIEAFSKTKVKDDVKLVISGKLGWLYDEVVAAPKKYGIEERVVFTRYINDAERYCLLQNALVYIQPSITEGFGLPVIEALQLGIPAMASNGGALTEVVPNSLGKSDKVWPTFDPYNIEEMKVQMDRIISDEKLRKDMVRVGKVFVKQFSWDEAAKKAFSILTNV